MAPQRVPSVVFQTRVRDESVPAPAAKPERATFEG